MDEDINISDANLVHDLGNCYEKANQIEKALSHYERAYNLRLTLFGKSNPHPDICDSLICLGKCYEKLHRHHESKKYYEEAYLMRKKLYNYDSYYIDEAASLLSNVMSKSKRPYQDARPHHQARDDNLQIKIAESLEKKHDYRNSLNVYEGSLRLVDNKEDSELKRAKIYYKIAFVNERLGRIKKSLEKLEEAITLTDEIEENFESREIQADCLNLKGTCLDKLGKYKEALEQKKLALEKREKVDFSDSPEKANVLNNIGVSHQKLGELKLALKYLKEAYWMRKSLYNDKDHEDIANSLHNIGILYEKMDESKRAYEKIKEAFEMRKRILRRHPEEFNVLDLASSYSSLSYFSAKNKDLDEAIINEENALQIKKKLFKDEPHIEVFNSMYNLANLYKKSKKTYKKSEEFFSELNEMKDFIFENDEEYMNYLLGHYEMYDDSKKPQNWKFKQVLEWFHENEINTDIRKFILSKSADGISLINLAKLNRKNSSSFSEMIKKKIGSNISNDDMEKFKKALEDLLALQN